MTGTARRALALLAIAAVVFSWAGFSAAQEAAADGETVIEVRVQGNNRLSPSAVLSHVKTRAGEPYDETVVKGDEQRLLETRQFSNVLVTKTPTNQGVIVTFTVSERGKIKSLSIIGAKSIKTATLMKELTFGAGDPLDRFNIEAGRKAIQNKYREKGYGQVDVSVDPDALADNNVLYVVREGPKIIIRKIVFDGNTHFSWLKPRMTIGSQARFWPFISGALDPEQVDRDVDTLRNLYIDAGFLDAEVGRRLDYSPDKSRVTIVFLIRQGARYRVNNIVFRGNTVFGGEELAGRVNMKSGRFFTADGLESDAKLIRDAYGEIGYIDATVRAGKQYTAPPEQAPGQQPLAVAPLVNVTYEIVEKDQYRVGMVNIRGNTVTHDRVIRRQLRFFPEQLFDTVAVEESRKRLTESRLFDKVTITPEGTTPGVRDALVKVEEGRTANFMIGVGVSSNNGLLGNITFTQRNFNILGWPNRQDKLLGRAWKGAGQTLTISVEPGTDMSQASIEWFEPALFDRNISLGQKIFYFQRGRESYDEQRVGYVPSLGHMFPNRWYGELSARFEEVNISNLDDDAPPEVHDVEGGNFLMGPKLTLTRDRTDSRWNPSSGDRLQFSHEQIFGSFTFSKVMADYRHYRTLYKDVLDRKHILASRVTVGQILGDAPVFEKFYGGGTGSIRGFQYRGVSPRSKGTNDPIGGDFLLLIGTEYTFPLIGDQLRGAIFLDTGTVEENPGITDYRATAGLGVRWVLPLLGQVPMSFDFGFPFIKASEDDTQIFSFSVGWTF